MMSTSKLRLNNLEYLADDMLKHDVDKTKFAFTYAKIDVDVIVAIMSSGYELLISVRAKKPEAFVIYVDKWFVAELVSDDYFRLCAALNLNYKNDGFSSSVFLKLLSLKIPKQYSGEKCIYKDLVPFVSLRNVEESDKVYFKGWNDHIKDGRKARNFDKTEFFFGKIVADYCRKHNISSMWTDRPNEEDVYRNPWD